MDALKSSRTKFDPARATASLRRGCGGSCRLSPTGSLKWDAAPRPTSLPPPDQEGSAGPRRAPPLPLCRVSFPSIHPSIPASLVPLLALPAPLDRGSAVTWVERERRREREREGARPLPSSAVCGVLCLRLGGRVRADGSLKQIPRCLVSSVPASLFTPPGWSVSGPPPTPPGSVFFLFFCALLHPVDSGQQFVLWDLFDSRRSCRVLRTYCGFSASAEEP